MFLVCKQLRIDKMKSFYSTMIVLVSLKLYGFLSTYRNNAELDNLIHKTKLVNISRNRTDKRKSTSEWEC